MPPQNTIPISRDIPTINQLYPWIRPNVVPTNSIPWFPVLTPSSSVDDLLYLIWYHFALLSFHH